MPRSTTMSEKHRSYLLSMARRRQRINFRSMTQKLNERFGTNFSIFAVAGFLGNYGFRQN